MSVIIYRKIRDDEEKTAEICPAKKEWWKPSPEECREYSPPSSRLNSGQDRTVGYAGRPVTAGRNARFQSVHSTEIRWYRESFALSGRMTVFFPCDFGVRVTE
jgi:hypothetical protein